MEMKPSFALLHKEELSPKNLQKCFQGFGRDTAQELAKRLETDEKLKTFRAFFQAPTEPRLTTKSFSAIPLKMPLVKPLRHFPIC